MSKRIIKIVKSKQQSEGVGAVVRRSIGTSQLRNLDPFLMLDEFYVSKPAGFPDHPHRGFETVTYMLEGSFQHEDFAGNKGTIGPGDLQWMTAGRGIVHAEMPLSDSATGLQLWLNLPKSKKMIAPSYQDLTSENVPVAHNEDGSVRVKVIAGESYGVKAKVHTNSPIYYLDVTIKPGGSFEQNVPEKWTAFVYTLDGSASFGQDGTRSDPHCTLVLDSEENDFIVKSENGARFVLIAGEPLGEPVVQHGPFVMNTAEEIQQAMLDYSMNQNGFEGASNFKSIISQIPI